jgi:hypothetical protein
MTDSDSAEQLKNLIIGVKALLSLSSADRKPLVDPLDIQAVGKDVSVYWKWPKERLSELCRLAQLTSIDAAPATAPAMSSP